MRLVRGLIAFIIALPVALPARAVSQTILISELQTGTPSGAGQEFVELYNASDSEQLIDGWKLQYRSASGTSWTQKAILAGAIEPYGYYLIAPTAYMPQADTAMSDGLAQAGGHVRIVDSVGTVVDLVGWGDTATAAEGSPAPAPAAGQSLERLPGEANPTGGNWSDTDANDADFRLRTTPEPQGKEAAAEVPDDFEEPDVVPPVSDTTRAPVTVEITELFIDPAQPLADAHDEFIELHNYGPSAVNLKDHRLQTGSSFHDNYTLPELVLAAGEYAALYARQTSLSLTNSGGAARLLDPAGNVIDQTADYEAAEEGESWVLIGGSWDWTTMTTPGAANLLVRPVVTADRKPERAAKKTAASKGKSSSRSRKAAAAKSSKAPKAAKTGTLTATATETPGGNGDSPKSRRLLWAALGLTISYGIYEFRHDLYNKYRLIRRKLGAGGADRPSA